MEQRASVRNEQWWVQVQGVIKKVVYDQGGNPVGSPDIRHFRVFENTLQTRHGWKEPWRLGFYLMGDVGSFIKLMHDPEAYDRINSQRLGEWTYVGERRFNRMRFTDVYRRENRGLIEFYAPGVGMIESNRSVRGEIKNARELRYIGDLEFFQERMSP